MFLLNEHEIFKSLWCPETVPIKFKTFSDLLKWKEEVRATKSTLESPTLLFMHYSVPLCAYATSKGAIQNAHIHTLVKEYLTANNPLPKKSELWLNFRTIQFGHISLW